MIKAVHAALWFSLMSGAALAQSAPSSAQAPVPPTPPPATVAPPGGDMAAPQARGTDDPYEGEIVQTPSGTYMVTEPAGGEQDMAPDVRTGPGSPDGAGPHPHPGHRMMPSKAAHIRLKGPDLALDVKCPDDEPVKACVEAVSQLMDKAGQAHH